MPRKIRSALAGATMTAALALAGCATGQWYWIQEGHNAKIALANCELEWMQGTPAQDTYQRWMTSGDREAYVKACMIAQGYELRYFESAPG